MAELKLKIIGDLKKLKKDIEDLVKEKFKIGVQGEGGGSGGGGAGAGGGKKGTGGIISSLGKLIMTAAPIALIVTKLNEIFNIVDLIANFAIFGIFKIIEGLSLIPDFLKNLWQGIKNVCTYLDQGFFLVKMVLKEKLQVLRDKLIELKDKFVEWLKVLPEKIKEKLIEGWKILLDIKDKLVAKLLELKDSFIEWIKTLPSKIWDFIKTGFVDLINYIKGLEITKKLIELKDKLVEKVEELRDKFKNLIENLPGRIFEAIKGLAQLIADKLKKVLSGIGGFFGFGSGGSTSADDAIIGPNGQIIRTDPRDTIIATQTPDASGSNTFVFNGVTPQEIIDKIERNGGIGQRRYGVY